MHTYTRSIARSIGIFTILSLALSFGGGAVEAETPPTGDVIKGKQHSTLYYVASDGKRYVFPNQGTFLSWYKNFDGVVEVADESLASYPLGGNVVYRPGALLVKIQTDPKVYVVSANGVLRWIPSEVLARKLYGEHWNLLVDDVPVAFFINYTIGDPVSNETEFDATEEEENIATIDENRKARKVKGRVVKKLIRKKTKLCDRLEHRLNKVQERLLRQGKQISGVGDLFLEQCIEGRREVEHNTTTTEVIDDGTGRGKEKVEICHVPRGNPSEAHTITVGAPALKAHLAHGDTVGACEGAPGDTGDTTPPVISGVTATPMATSTTISWTTNEASTGKVEYATSTLASAGTIFTVLNETLTTSHALVLPDLASSTQHFYIVKSKDAAGNVATTTEQTFTTTP